VNIVWTWVVKHGIPVREVIDWTRVHSQGTKGFNSQKCQQGCTNTLDEGRDMQDDQLWSEICRITNAQINMTDMKTILVIQLGFHAQQDLLRQIF
jgi:hypothetical protein